MVFKLVGPSQGVNSLFFGISHVYIKYIGEETSASLLLIRHLRQRVSAKNLEEWRIHYFSSLASNIEIMKYLHLSWPMRALTFSIIL